MGKLGPIDERQGTVLYPGFYRTTPPGFSRLQRLETGSQRLQRGKLRPSSGAYTRMPKDFVATKPNSTQVLSLSRSTIRKIGGVSISGSSGSFGYVSSSSQITWYWDGTNSSQIAVIHRADGTNFTVPTTGSGLVVTGLSASTDYYFLPFWNVTNTCNIGWVQGTVGTPQIAFTLADTTGVNANFYLLQQTLEDNEALSPTYMKATTASGGGSGGGGIPTCVRAGTIIAPVGDIPYECDILPESDWIYLKTEQGKELFCTFDHPLYHAVNGKVPADSLVVGDLVITDEGEQKLVTAAPCNRKCSKYHVRMPRGHLYFANGFLSHNYKIPL